jgi:uncharacterized protein (TIGR02147 family)
LSSAEKKEKPNCLVYDSPGKFLFDFFQWKKASKPSFSLRSRLHKQANRISVSSASNIINGKAPIKPHHIEDLRFIFHFNQEETEWLHLMCTPHANKERIQARRERSKISSRNDICEDWLFVYTKDCIQLLGEKASQENIVKALADLAEPSRIHEALDFLLANQYIEKTDVSEEPFYKTMNLLEVSTDEISAEKIRAFHRKALNIASERIEAAAVEEREFYTLTINLSNSVVPTNVQLSCHSP